MLRTALFFLFCWLVGSLTAQQLLINEVCASARASFVDDYGEFEDWIELYNPGRTEINVAGWYISDKPNNPTKWKIRGHEPRMTTIQPGQYLVLWADKDTLQGATHINIKLSSNGEEVLLFRPTADGVELVDRVNYPKLKADRSYGRCHQTPGGWTILDRPSPGLKNICPPPKPGIGMPSAESIDYEDLVLLYLPLNTQSNDLRINELVPNNFSGITDEFGERDDWIELYNPGQTDVNIAGWYISDTLNAENFYRIPAFDLTKTIVPAGGYLLLWADGEPAEGVLHMPFRLNNNGEAVYLARMVNNNLVMVDQVVFPRLLRDVPYGRLPNGTGSFQRLSDPTPLQSNIAPRVIGPFILNELMAVRGSGLLDEFGEEEDWIEFYNPTAQGINLGGLYLSDSLNDPLKFRIGIHAPDSTTIPPGGYLVFFADGDRRQGIRHIDFKLGGGGERIALYQADGITKILEIRYPYQASDASFGRFPNGQDTWIHTIPTPGAANRYVFQPVSGIKINEFLAENLTHYPDRSGQFEDWIELYNTNNYPVNVGGLYMTDTLNDRLKFRIPNTYPDSTTIPARGYLVFWADNDPEEGVRHLDFRLASEGEAIGLVQFQNTAVVLDSYVFAQQQPDVSLGRFPDGTDNWQSMVHPTPGQANTAGTGRIQGLYINEFMARNTRTYADETGAFEDWIEIYNSTNDPITLTGLYMTDLYSNPLMSPIPSAADGNIVIGPKTHMIFWADGKPQLGPKHFNFQLAGGGENLALVQLHLGQAVFIDSLTYPPQTADVSFGRLGDGGSYWAYFRTPTPNAPNSTSGAKQINLLSAINAYPNPFTENLVVQLSGIPDEWVNVEIIDLFGKIVFTDRLEVPLGGFIEMDPSHWDFGLSASGVFIIQIRSETSQIQKKVIRLN